MGRKVAAVLAGMMTVVVVVTLLQWVGARLYPLPAGVDPMDPAGRDAFLEYAATMPLGVWALAFASELMGAFLGGWVAGRVARAQPRLFVGIIVGLALVGSVANWTSFPHPTWFIGGQLLGYPLVFLAATRVLGEGQDPEATPRSTG